MSQAKPDNRHTLLSGFAMACLALMCVVPFLQPHHYPPIASFFNEWIAAVLAVGAAVFLIGRSRAQFHFPPLTLVPILLIVLAGVQIILGRADYWQHHFLFMLYLGLAAVMMLLGANLRHLVSLDRIVPVLAWSILTGGVLAMILLIIGRNIGDEHVLAKYILDGRGGNVGQVNHLSNYLAMALASLGYLWLNGRVNRWLFIALTLLLVLGLAIGGQRMAILYVLVLSIGGWLLARSAMPAGQSSSARHILWLIPVFIVMQLIAPWLTFLEPAAMPAQRLAETAGQSSTRLMILEQAWMLFREYPWLGAGWGEFAWHNFNLTEQYPDLDGLWNNAHNIVAHSLAELGLVGAVILLTGVIGWLVQQRHGELSLERVWILALLSIVGIHSLLEYPLWYLTFLTLTALLFGLGAQTTWTFRFRLAPVLFLAVFVFACWTLGNMLKHYFVLETTLTELRENQDEIEDVESYIQKLREIRNYSVFSPIADNFIVRVLPYDPQLYRDKLAIHSPVIEHWPGRVEAYTHAALLALNGNGPEAQDMIKKAILQFPEYRKAFHRFVLSKVVKGESDLLPILLYLQDEPENWPDQDKTLLDTDK